jgi:glycosyl transferase family 25
MLVLEDDVHFHGLAPLLADTGWMPADADIIKCETLRRKVRLGPLQDGVAATRLARLRSRHLGTGGYFVSRRGAAKLLRQSETLCEAVDQFMFNDDIAGQGRFVIYQTMPAPVVQDANLRAAHRRNYASTLDAERGARPSKSLSPLAKLWREAKRLADLRPLLAPLVCRLTSKDRIIRIPFGGDRIG